MPLCGFWMGLLFILLLLLYYYIILLKWVGNWITVKGLGILALKCNYFQEFYDLGILRKPLN
jgi:hypothetical protein